MYKYYQPNKYDLKDEYGDCATRALSKALGITWEEAFDICTNLGKKYHCPFECMPLKLYKEVFKELGFTYHGISNKKGSRRPTVESFIKEHNNGTYILSVAGHFVCAIDGTYYDTWTCGNKYMYGYYEKDE